MSELVKISNNYQMQRNFQKLNEFRNKNQYCDVLLLVEGREIQAHQCVLAAGSKYFEDRLCGETVPRPKQEEAHPQASSPDRPEFKANNQIKIEMKHDTTYEIMLIIVNYLYTGIIEYGNDSLLLLVSNFKELGIECGSVLQQFLNNDNCFELFKIEDGQCGAILKPAARLHIANHLNVLTSKEDFQTLSKDEISSILSLAAEIDIESIAVFQSIITWIKHDEANRVSYFDHLLDYVSFGSLSAHQIKNQILSNDILRNSAYGCKWFVNGMTDPTGHLTFRISGINKMYVFSRGAQTQMFILSNEYNENYHLSEDERPEFDSFAMTKYKNVIYAVGGKRHNQIVNIGLKYNPEHNSWTEFLCPIGKAGCGVCTTKTGQMIVIGGVSENVSQKSCSSYDYTSGQWSALPNMSKARWNPGVASCNSSIYVFGGISHGDSQPIVERYDPREGIWSNAGELPFYQGTATGRIGLNIYCLKVGSKELMRYDTRTMNPTNVFNVDDVRGEWLTALNEQLYILHKNGITAILPDAADWEHISYTHFEAYSILVV